MRIHRVEVPACSPCHSEHIELNKDSAWYNSATFNLRQLHLTENMQDALLVQPTTMHATSDAGVHLHARWTIFLRAAVTDLYGGR
jgi:hypothetical protein